MQVKSKIKYFFVLLIGGILGFGCSTRKNTPGTRAYHELTARYNVFHNAQQAYNDLLEDQLMSFSDNWFELLPFYPERVGTEKTQPGGPFDVVIDKTTKAIQEHSISAKPRRDPAKAQSPEYRQWLRQEEFNPFIKNAWLLMGKAHVQNRDYEQALSVFSEILRIYPNDIDLISEVQIWMMRTYTEMNRMYDAENMVYILRSRNLPSHLNRLFTETYTYYLLQRGEYNDAIPFLKKVIKQEKNSIQKKRLQFLLGQICIMSGENEKAYQAFEEVKGLSTPYELALNTSIYQVAVSSGEQQKKQLNEWEKLRKKVPEANRTEYDIDSLTQTIRQNLTTVKQEKSPVSSSTAHSQNIVKGLSQWKMLTENASWQTERNACSDDMEFIVDKTTSHLLLLLPYRSEEINELIFATANFNFSRFNLRTFNLTPIQLKQREVLRIGTFHSFDDASHYLQLMESDSVFNATSPDKVSPIIISEENLSILQSQRTLEEYSAFCAANFDIEHHTVRRYTDSEGAKTQKTEKIVSLDSDSIDGSETITIPAQKVETTRMLPVPEKNEPVQLQPVNNDRRIDPSELKRRLELKAAEAVKQSETASPDKSREELLKEREQQRREKIKEREQELKERQRIRETELKQREQEREQQIQEQERLRKKKLEEREKVLQEREREMKETESNQST